jgi:2-polyprenyl-3-methyl-5-hydroxy-6-metoxy-1,4-benzoquinol methylase
MSYTRNSGLSLLPSPNEYWEQRAQRFAADDLGLKAVCSYGMPSFYNSAIDITQRHALMPWIRKARGKTVLDLGCGVGRWSRLMAAQGAKVTGLDLSPTMIKEAGRRAAEEGVAGNCNFLVGDVAELDRKCTYDQIFVITVLQHILDLERLTQAAQVLKRHLAPGGNIVVLEAAPTGTVQRCDTAVFHARTEFFYFDLFQSNGLAVREVRGVDPVPLKTLLLPHYRRLPDALRIPALALVTGLSLPADLLLARYCRRASWHKLFVLEHAGSAGGGAYQQD